MTALVWLWLARKKAQVGDWISNFALFRGRPLPPLRPLPPFHCSFPTVLACSSGWEHFLLPTLPLTTPPRLCSGLLHVIEGRFGTAVYQYFVLLRYLITLNIATSLIFIVFLVVPQLIDGTPPQVHSGIRACRFFLSLATHINLNPCTPLSPPVEVGFQGRRPC